MLNPKRKTQHQSGNHNLKIDLIHGSQSHKCLPFSLFPFSSNSYEVLTSNGEVWQLCWHPNQVSIRPMALMLNSRNVYESTLAKAGHLQ